MAFSRGKIVGLIMVVAGLAVVAALWSAPGVAGGPLRSRERRAWKQGAIAEIERRVADEAWRAGEVARIRERGASRHTNWGTWLGDELLVMANGEWMVCRNICRKSDPRIHDLFIGRGSDGRWYYSTFHFCVRLNVLLNEGQPGSLAEFAEAYWLEPFDGRSDACLKATWESSEPWGDEKLQARRGRALNR